MKNLYNTIEQNLKVGLQVVIKDLENNTYCIISNSKKDMNNKLKIAFDVDDTLIIPSVASNGLDVPNYETIKVFKWFQEQGNDMIIWSGSGIDWATNWKNKLGLNARIIVKGSEDVDIAFDDCDVILGKVNVKVKRINNQISRSEWNKNKEL